MSSQIKRLPSRNKVKISDTWDLSSLYPRQEAWEKDLAKFKRRIARFEKFRGTLADGPKQLAACLKFDMDFDRLAERLGIFAMLKVSQDQSDSGSQAMMGRFQNLATRAAEAASFIHPEILEIPTAKMKKFLASKPLAVYQLHLERLLRFKPYTLGDKEERLLAMQGEMAQAAGHAFRQLLDTDLVFGVVADHEGKRIELTHSTFGQLLRCPKRSVRKRAFDQYYQQFIGHENTLAATLSGSIHKDIYYAKARGYESALDSALFADNVPQSVYENLIVAVRDKLPVVHHYFDVRRRKMKLRQIHHYDTYAPIVSELSTKRTWNQAVKTILQALEPLGSDYCGVLSDGLHGRWCDRYANKGKRSGAFSCGSFDGDPYILMNYQPEVLDDMFTLAHEAGHSMHSYYSAKHQRYLYYQYVIFVAEVASTFNEQLLSHHLMQNARSPRQRALLVNRDIDAIRGTIIRQTMFAEFEKITHEMAEAGEPLTLQALKDVYWKLLEDYFGGDFVLDQPMALEGLRIPHFYRAFYVYKYATGLSAAVALSQRVLEGGPLELQQYLGFLKGGGSKFPLDLLRDAGVDMTTPEPVTAALNHFERLVDELDQLL